MGFKCGIVGLPNVGKSTLFNALTQADIESENYPFCKIEPNVGVVTVNDLRLNELSEIVNASYAKTKDIRKTMRETGVSFSEVWEMVGMKDYFDFEEIGED